MTSDAPAQPAADPWRLLPARFRERGLRWTPQRQVVVDVLAATEGHVTAAELVERCRAVQPSTIPSTVHRTLDVLEELGLVRHGHAADGREEFHVQPASEHGHRHCADCGATWEIPDAQAAALARALEDDDGFEVDISHVTIVGRCRACREAAGG